MNYASLAGQTGIINVQRRMLNENTQFSIKQHQHALFLSLSIAWIIDDQKMLFESRQPTPALD
jgi:hypothetical protein